MLNELVGSLYCTPANNITPYVSYTGIKIEKKNHLKNKDSVILERFLVKVMQCHVGLVSVLVYSKPRK